jgi:hypothetical protein
MSVIAAALKHMLAANMPHEAILRAVEDMEAGLQKDEQAERRRESDRERKRSKRLRISADSADKADSLRGSVTRVEDKTSNLEIEPQKKEQKERNALTRDFEDWYAGYPHKVGRGAAERAFPKALSLAGLPELKAGVARYIQSKPADRAWQNPSTWLNNKGWLDQPANVVPMARGSPPRPMDEFISSVLTRMDEADAVSSAQIERYPEAPRRLSGNVSG